MFCERKAIIILFSTSSGSFAKIDSKLLLSVLSTVETYAAVDCGAVGTKVARPLEEQVSVVMWFAPRPPVRVSRVRIPSQHGNLVKFILVWVFFNPSGILTQPYPAFLLNASRPFNRWPSVQFGSLSPLTAKC